MLITIGDRSQQIDDPASLTSLVGDFAFFDGIRAWVFPERAPRSGADGGLGITVTECVEAVSFTGAPVPR